jgi:hypothetical protein
MDYRFGMHRRSSSGSSSRSSGDRQWDSARARSHSNPNPTSQQAVSLKLLKRMEREYSTEQERRQHALSNGHTGALGDADAAVASPQQAPHEVTQQQRQRSRQQLTISGSPPSFKVRCLPVIALHSRLLIPTHHNSPCYTKIPLPDPSFVTNPAFQLHLHQPRLPTPSTNPAFISGRAYSIR